MPKPRLIRVGGDQYESTVLLVTDRDSRGRPLVARFVHDEETINLKELGAEDPKKTPEFIIVYANRKTWGSP